MLGELTARVEPVARRAALTLEPEVEAFEAEYHHQIPGFTARLDGLQTVILRVKLRRLDEWNERTAVHEFGAGRAVAA